jgi:hypothetical protein
MLLDSLTGMYNRIDDVTNITEKMSLGRPEATQVIDRKRTHVESDSEGDSEGEGATAAAAAWRQQHPSKRARSESNDREDTGSLDHSSSRGAHQSASPTASKASSQNQPPAPMPTSFRQSSTSERSLSQASPISHQPSQVPAAKSPVSRPGIDDDSHEMDVDIDHLSPLSSAEESDDNVVRYTRSSARAAGKMPKQTFSDNDDDGEDEVVSESRFIQQDIVAQPDKKGKWRKIRRRFGGGDRQDGNKSAKAGVKNCERVIRTLMGLVSCDFCFL